MRHRYLLGSGLITVGMAIALDGLIRSVLVTALVIVGVSMLASDA